MNHRIRRTGLTLVLLSLLAACTSAPPVTDPPEPLSVLSGERRSLRLSQRSPLTPLASAQAGGAEVPPVQAATDENSIFFGIASTEVSSEEKAKLLKHAARLKADEKLSVVLLGHCDDLGSTSINLAIAERRAEAVYRLLRSAGVPATQLRRYPAGAEKNDARKCQSQSCRERVHRVELIFSSVFSLVAPGERTQT